MRFRPLFGIFLSQMFTLGQVTFSFMFTLIEWKSPKLTFEHEFSGKQHCYLKI